MDGQRNSRDVVDTLRTLNANHAGADASGVLADELADELEKVCLGPGGWFGSDEKGGKFHQGVTKKLTLPGDY